MKQLLLFPIVVILSSFPGPDSVVDAPVCLNSEEQLLYTLIMDYRKANGLGSIPCRRAFPGSPSFMHAI